ncbi:MAG: B12-binding domain-containing radical SAM protein [Lachnospiraceae bacterium]|jgi:radical SAM superfamily enzyme YgiQ (UPF0313 family)
MKILLTAVNAKYIHTNLAVYSLQAYAKAYASFVAVNEYTINQQKDEILKGLYEQHPDVLCFSCYIWNISFVKEIMEDIHKVMPQVPIWVGGPEVSYDAEAFLKECPYVAGVMMGEGEETFLELVRYYVGQESGTLSEIKGITYRGEAGIQANPWREVLDLSTLPFVYEDMEEFAHKIIYYESSRGCPFSCSYCLSSVDKRLRFRDLELVKEELQFFLDKRVPQVKFVDRTFNCKHSHAMAVWSYLKEHDNGVTNFHFEIAADLLTEEEMDLIAGMRPGLIQLEIGVQSTNPKTIEEIRRKMDFKEVCRIVKRVQAGRNIHQHLDLIAGLPYEDYESFGHSFDDVYALHPEQLQLGFLKVLKGSYMHEMAETYACIYKSREPYEVLSTRWLSYQDVLRLKAVEEMVEVYYNSGQFKQTLSAMEKLFDRPFVMFEKLARYYEEQGLYQVSHTRIRRYEILIGFLEELQREWGKPKEWLDYYRELLIYDLYIRENMKSRPDWAKDLLPYKERIKSFYRREEEEPVYLPGYQGMQAKQMARMTHVEVFSYPVLEDTTAEEILEQKGEFFLLFDYQSRDPLTYDGTARMVELS